MSAKSHGYSVANLLSNAPQLSTKSETKQKPDAVE